MFYGGGRRDRRRLEIMVVVRCSDTTHSRYEMQDTTCCPLQLEVDMENLMWGSSAKLKIRNEKEK